MEWTTSAPTVDEIADIRTQGSDARPCGAVLHTAALHAPHASSWHAHEFVATNVHGTENVLSLGLPTVHTSTTSLTITKRVKEREKYGELVWLDEHAQRPGLEDDSTYDLSLDAPRNKYTARSSQPSGGASPLRTRALTCASCAPRFFPEEVLEEGATLSLPNIKANELLGRRCALVDLVDAELRASHAFGTCAASAHARGAVAAGTRTRRLVTVSGSADPGAISTR